WYAHDDSSVVALMLSGHDKIGALSPWKVVDASLVLEDGSIWKAKSFGASGAQLGEVVFNTLLTGYQEILTDPSYAGQFVLMTCPHIDNIGVNIDYKESIKCFLADLVIRSLSIRNAHIQRKTERKLKRLDQEVAAYPNGYDLLAYDHVSGFPDE
nr:carbamoyl-phosphate synthase small chain, chloroplastic-like isoform X2 [Tanacetum cinerariifolium]